MSFTSVVTPRRLETSKVKLLDLAYYDDADEETQDNFLLEGGAPAFSLLENQPYAGG